MQPKAQSKPTKSSTKAPAETAAKAPEGGE
jgi:hypothetical protein